MTKYGYHGKLTATEGNADELSKILLQASETVAKTKGCLLYVIGLDDTDPNAVWVTEIWESKEDHNNSLNETAVKELIGQAIPLLDGMPEKGLELRILGGFGL